MVLFVVLTLFSLIMADIAVKKESKVALFLCILSITLYSACRSVTVGIDTKSVYNSAQTLFNGGYVYFKDIGYKYLMTLTMHIFKNPAGHVFVCSAITNVCLLCRMWDYRKESSFVTMLFVYLAFFYPESMNIMRQYLAASIVFWGTRYLEKGKYAKYTVICVIAYTLHASAILGLLMLLFYVLRNSNIPFIRKLIVFIFGAVVAGIILLYYFDIGKYTHYFTDVKINIGMITLFKFLVLLFIIAISKNSFKNTFSYDIEGNEVGMDKAIVFNYMVGLLLSAIGMIFVFMGRVGTVFLLFEIPFSGQVVRAKYNRPLYKTLVYIPALFAFIMLFVADGNQIFPYSFFWKM